MTEEIKKNLRRTQRRMMRMVTQTKRKSQNNSAAAHSANVDEAVDDEPRDTEIVSEEGTSKANPQDPSSKMKATKTPTAIPFFYQITLGHSGYKL